MITAAAPASVAFLAFKAKPQSPASTSAILPATAPALENGEQPSVDVPPASTASAAASTLPDTLGLPTVGPERRGAELITAGDACRGVDLDPRTSKRKHVRHAGGHIRPVPDDAAEAGGGREALGVRHLRPVQAERCVEQLAVVVVGEAEEERAGGQARELTEAEAMGELVQQHRHEIVERPVVVVEPQVEVEVGAEVRVDVVVGGDQVDARELVREGDVIPRGGQRGVRKVASDGDRPCTSQHARARAP